MSAWNSRIADCRLRLAHLDVDKATVSPQRHQGHKDVVFLVSPNGHPVVNDDATSKLLEVIDNG
jgi:hypothetical protein